jgi:GT2 family glycosyltransferase
LDCLHSIQRATRDIQHEILLIDNQSVDQTKTFVKEFKPSITLLENSENLGFAKAVNRGLKKAFGEFILLLNPDVIIQSDSLNPMMDFMRNHPKTGICGCQLVNPDGFLQYSKGSFPTLFSLLCRTVLPRRMRKYHLWGYDRIGRCDWVTGAYMLIRHHLIEEMGGFDETYFLYYEDMDYCLQAKKRGWEIYYYPGIKAFHMYPHATSPRKLAIEHEIHRSRLYFFRKNESKFSYYIVFGLTHLLLRRSLFSTSHS